MGEVVFCGENPGMRLFRPGAPQPALVASWWRTAWSPHGSGDSVVLWTDGAADLPADLPGVYTDAPELARWLDATFTRHFPEFAGIDVDALPVRPATLTAAAAGVGWRHGDRTVELAWADELDRRLTTIADFLDGSTGHDLSTVYCPTAAATVRVDGRLLPLAPQIEPGPRPASTAFLARCEVWTVRCG